MEKKFIKNIDFAKAIELESFVEYQEGTVVSKTLAQGKPLSLTLFAFDKGEEISTHASPGEAMVYILDGVAEITIGEEIFNLKKGETIIMPSNIPHGLKAPEKFKMMLIVIFNLS